MTIDKIPTNVLKAELKRREAARQLAARQKLADYISKRKPIGYSTNTVDSFNSPPLYELTFHFKSGTQFKVTYSNPKDRGTFRIAFFPTLPLI